MNLFKSYLLIFLITLGLGQKAWSQNDFDVAAYETSKALCSTLTDKNLFSQSFSNFHIYVLTSSLKETDDHLVKIASGVFNSEKRKLIQDFKTAGVLGDLLHSQGFMQAMRECFPDESQHHRFVLTLILAEKLGNFVILAAQTVGLSLSIRFLMTRFPQFFTIKTLKSFLKIAILMSPLSLRSSTDLESASQAKKASLETRIANLENQLKDQNLKEVDRKSIHTELKVLLLQKALDSF